MHASIDKRQSTAHCSHLLEHSNLAATKTEPPVEQTYRQDIDMP
jgi:hypothetical protein